MIEAEEADAKCEASGLTEKVSNDLQRRNVFN